MAKERALKAASNTFKRTYNADTKRVNKRANTLIIHALQEAVEKLTVKIEAKSAGPNAAGLSGSSYAAAA